MGSKKSVRVEGARWLPLRISCARRCWLPGRPKRRRSDESFAYSSSCSRFRCVFRPCRRGDTLQEVRRRPTPEIGVSTCTRVK